MKSTTTNSTGNMNSEMARLPFEVHMASAGCRVFGIRYSSPMSAARRAMAVGDEMLGQRFRSSTHGHAGLKRFEQWRLVGAVGEARKPALIG